ncbi:MAG TPA: hypothetical protein VHZ24_16440 [Pirellulales bacterium]|nr:hypothetical protein [Pirellulales bacterium]
MERSNRVQPRRLKLVSVCSLAMTLLLIAMVIVSQTGCASALAAVAYVIKGREIKAEYAGLKNKRVAVVCRPLAQLEYSAGNASAELARQLGILLRRNIRGIEIVDAEQVAEWVDEHNWSEYTEIGEALDADMVVGLDLRDFGLYQGMTLYQGHAKVALAVYDMRRDGQVVYQKILPQSIYPPNTGIPTSEKADDEFRRQYLTVLADEIGRYFYDHDGEADIARDVTAALR